MLYSPLTPIPDLGARDFPSRDKFTVFDGESPKHMQGPIGSDPGTQWKGELAVCQDLQQFTCLWVLLTEKIRVSVKYGVKASKERLVLSVTAAPGPDSGGTKDGFLQRGQWEILERLSKKFVSSLWSKVWLKLAEVG